MIVAETRIKISKKCFIFSINALVCVHINTPYTYSSTSNNLYKSDA